MPNYLTGGSCAVATNKRISVTYVIAVCRERERKRMVMDVDRMWIYMRLYIESRQKDHRSVTNSI